MKIHYQSFVDEASASGYWAKLNAVVDAKPSDLSMGRLKL